jgi:uncharacterized protein (DUF4415 family)
MTGKKRATAGDLKKGNERALRKKGYDDIPELTDTDFARGVWHRNGKPLPPGPLGRPKSKNPKRPVSIRLDPDVLSHFRRSGRGWQSRINAALRKVAKLPEKTRKTGTSGLSQRRRQGGQLAAGSGVTRDTNPV